MEFLKLAEQYAAARGDEMWFKEVLYFFEPHLIRHEDACIDCSGPRDTSEVAAHGRTIRGARRNDTHQAQQ